MEIFSFTDYRAYLRAMLRPEAGRPRGSHTLLAEAAGCRSSYLSQVLGGTAQLTPDHGVGVCEFLGLTELEADYFLALLDHARAGTPPLRKRLESRLHSLRHKHENLSERFPKAQIGMPLEQAMTYYSSWHWAAVHMILGIPDLRTPEAIATHLQLPLTLVQDTLVRLAAMGLVKKQSGTWRLVTRDLHLPRDAVMVALGHTNWRQRAAMKLQEGQKENLFYTGVHTVSRKDFERIKGILLDAIAQARAVVGPSEDEEMVCFLCDLFRV